MAMQHWFSYFSPNRGGSMNSSLRVLKRWLLPLQNPIQKSSHSDGILSFFTWERKLACESSISISSKGSLRIVRCSPILSIPSKARWFKAVTFFVDCRFVWGKAGRWLRRDWTLSQSLSWVPRGRRTISCGRDPKTLFHYSHFGGKKS